MTEQEKLEIFCQGYLEGVLASVTDADCVDDWVLWGGYDINLTGRDYDQGAQDERELACSVYMEGWEVLPSTPMFRFTVKAHNQGD